MNNMRQLGKFSENLDAVAAVERVNAAFRDRTQPWHRTLQETHAPWQLTASLHRCFRSLYIQAANLTAAEDWVYDAFVRKLKW